MNEEKEVYHPGAEPPTLETVITWVYHFPDGSKLTVVVDAPPAEGEGEDQASQNYHLYLTDRLALIQTLNPRPLRQELMTVWLDAAQAAATPDDLAQVLAEARAELTETEYQALVAALSSAGNITA